MKTLLIVDDEPANLHVLRQILHEDYRLVFARDGRKALELAKEALPDLILLDVMLPGTSGYQVCELLKQDIRTSKIPVIFVTAMTDAIDETHGFEVGAVDYITKPVNPAIVRARVATHLTLVRTDELEETRLQIVQRLGRAAEYRDNETGRHVIRISHYAKILALAAGFSRHDANELFHAAPMHDVGKIGIPDNILLKPGPLSEEDWILMRRHPQMGAEIIGYHHSSLLQMARTIALAHHEKWDGSGYPYKLSGEQIPIVGRIIAIADVFDALTTERPYKKAWPVEDAIALIESESGCHFDPGLVPLFLGQMPEVRQVMLEWAEEPTPNQEAEMTV